MKKNLFLTSNGTRLHTVSFGDSQNTPIVLLHGYPDNHQVWDAVASRLGEKFYVITYDVRGAGASDKPKLRADYQLNVLVADLANIADQLLPGRRFHLVGHDWGSVQGWEAVSTEPLKNRIISFTSISGPCLNHVGHWLRQRAFSLSLRGKVELLKQVISSWYVGVLHLPFLPQLAWSAGLDKLWPRYLCAWESVSAMTFNPSQREDGKYGVQLYRANLRNKLTTQEERYADCPVQLIVPTQDKFVGAHLYEDLPRWAPNLYRREIYAKHWLPLTHPELLVAWITEFTSGVETGCMSSRLQHAKVRINRKNSRY